MKRFTAAFSLLLSLVLLIPLCAHAEESAGTDWYLEKAADLKERLHDIVSFDGFAEFYTADSDIISLLDSWNAAIGEDPESVSGYPLPPLSMISEFSPETENLPEALLQKIERTLPALLVSQLNGMKGVHFLAAANIPVLSEGYIMPDDFEPCIVLYEYDDICVSVSFTQIGEGVVSATAQFCAPEITDMLTGGSKK